MSRRLPACDPCRSSKLSCDHTKPVCSRCKTRDIVADCSYRERPFKKRKVQALLEVSLTTPRETAPPITPASEDTHSLSENVSRKSRLYPNPGYLGSSSHTTFFDHLSGTDHSLDLLESTPIEGLNHQKRSLGCAVNDEKVNRGAALLDRIVTCTGNSSWDALVIAWMKEGINLPVAEPFTLACATATCRTIQSCKIEVTSGLHDLQPTAVVSRELLSQSCFTLRVGTNDSIDDFCELFCEDNVRWETLGLFFTAVSRATIDITTFEGVYNSEHERRTLRKLAMQFSDACLDLALSLDCLNDLQLILQYENFILHSLVDGDQSESPDLLYLSWKLKLVSRYCDGGPSCPSEVLVATGYRLTLNQG